MCEALARTRIADRHTYQSNGPQGLAGNSHGNTSRLGRGT